MEQQSTEMREVNGAGNDEQMPPPESEKINGDQANVSENDNKKSKSDSNDKNKGESDERKGTIINVSINTLCNIIGGGILSLPLATLHGSVVVTIIMFIICCIIAAFSAFALAYGCEVSQKFNYSDAVLSTLSPSTPLKEGKVIDVEQEAKFSANMSDSVRRKRNALMILIEFIIFMFNYGSLVIYSIVIVDSIPPVLSNFLHARGIWVQKWLWLVVPSIIFFILGCARALHELKWSSFVGFATIFYVVLLVIARFFTNMSTPVTQDEGRHDIRWAEVRLSLLSTISQLAFSIAYHYNVPGFYRELNDRRPVVLLNTAYISYSVVFFCYCVTGILGYLTFGALVNSKEASGNIMNNFSNDDIPANIGRLGLFFHFVCVYPIVEVACRRNLHRFICLIVDNIKGGKKTAPTEPLNEDNKISSSTQDVAPAVDTTAESEFAENKDSNASPVNEESAKTEAPPTEVADAPPGDPSTTTRLSIIIEAFALVLTATLIAAFVPGIGVVVELLGCLFGHPILFIMPAAVGIKVFKEGVVNLSPFKIRLYGIFSWITLVLGFIFMIIGLVSFFMSFG